MEESCKERYEEGYKKEKESRLSRNGEEGRQKRDEKDCYENDEENYKEVKKKMREHVKRMEG